MVRVQSLPRRLGRHLVISLWTIIFSSALVYYHITDRGKAVIDTITKFLPENSSLETTSEPGSMELSDTIASPTPDSEPEPTAFKPVPAFIQQQAGLRKSGVKSVVILTYQRCGSTFFGQMFNTNPKAFYLFEPLDALYSSMYGTKQGYNVPTDITNYPDGTRRSVPLEEVNAVSRYISNLFSCDLALWPTEALIHSYWTQMPREMLASAVYSRCLRMRPKTYHSRVCDEHNPWYCGVHFGEHPDEKRLSACRQIMKGEDSVSVNRMPQYIQNKYHEYQTCLANSRAQVETRCGPFLQRLCKATTLKAAKIVRGTMHSMDELLRSNPDFHVIHLLRDPRAVAASRRATRDDSIIGRYAIVDGVNGTNITLKEAAVYCRAAVDDIIVRRQLEFKYPGRILTVRYEDVVDNVESNVDTIYRWLGVTPTPREVTLWIRRNRLLTDKASRKSTYTSPIKKWTKVLTADESRTIVDDLCRDFFRLVNYDVGRQSSSS